MSGLLRVLDTGPRDARENVAISAALLETVGCGEAPATLRFGRYRPSCVIGRFQDAAAEVDLAGCAAAGVALARRVTGGGAVVMGPGVLAFDLVLPGSAADARRVGAIAAEALLGMLAEFGIAATRAGIGSLEVGGRKISGSAGRVGRGAVLHQATLVLDLAAVPPLALLRRRTEGGRPTADPAHRVTSLADVMSAPSSHLRHPEEARSAVSKHAPRSSVLRDSLLRRLPQHDEGGDSYSWSGSQRDEVGQLLLLHVATGLDAEPVPGRLSPAEERLARSLLQATIGRDDFALRGVLAEDDCSEAA